MTTRRKMEGLPDAYKHLVPFALIRSLKSKQQVRVAENVLKQNGLHWSSSDPSDIVYISGSNYDVLDFAVECLESMLDESRNPSCSLSDRKTKFVFKGTLGKKILESTKVLQEKCMYVSVYEDKYQSEVLVSCDYDDYSKIRKTIDEIRNSTPSSTDSLSVLDKSVVEGRSHYNGYPGSSSAPLFHFQHSKFQYSFKAKSIQVYVYKASIIDVIGIDAIVNAANEDLRHDSGVAYAICEAAGYSVRKQCSEHLNKHGRVPVGQNCVTRTGNLKHLKAIIHAVGPRWDDYSEKKQCTNDLYETVINVLRTAHTHSLQKIALPPISAGIFKVPKDLCAQMYIKAVINYSRNVKPNNVTEIHFVDIKDDFLKAIREAHENWMKSPDLLDFKNALEYASPQGGAKARPVERTPSYSDREGKGYPKAPHADYSHHRVDYTGTKRLSFGTGEQTIFKVDKIMTIRIYTGSIVKVSDADALVCNVGPDLNGGRLAQAFLFAGGDSYTRALTDLKKHHHTPGQVVLCSPGKLKSQHVLLAVMAARAIITVDTETAKKLKEMYVQILQRASDLHMKKIALTLIGSGLLDIHSQHLEFCCNSLFEGLIEARMVRKICLEDIQVVNIHPEVTETIVKFFKKRSTPMLGRTFSDPADYNLHNLMPRDKPSNMFPKGNSFRMPKEDKRKQKWDKQEKHNSLSYRKEQKLDERVKHSSMYQPSTQWFSLDQDDDHNDQGQDEIPEAMESEQKQPKPGNGESWIQSDNHRKQGNLPLYNVEDGQLKTLGNLSGETSTGTCTIDECSKKAEKALGCGHKFCVTCFVPVQSSLICTICHKKSFEDTLGASSAESRKVTEHQKASSVDDTCIICMEKLIMPYKLTCGHDCFHEKCIKDAFVYKEVCPVCGTVLGTVTGNQPYGTMEDEVLSKSLPGYDGCGTIQILYKFHDGKQTEKHPHPESSYKGTRRRAFLPNNNEGRKILEMLKVAFKRKLVFTIGESRTSGKTDTVTWNDIHHKTRMEGGPSNYGYPDPDYLRRVKEELEAKGVTEADIRD